MARISQAELEDRRMKVLALMMGGVTRTAVIAERLGWSVDAIRDDKKWLEGLYRERAHQEIALAKGQDFERIERLIAAAWPKAMDRSSKGQVSAIRVIKELLERKAKMLGYDEPDKVQQAVGIVDAREFPESVAALSDEQAYALYREIKSLPETT